MITRNQLFTIVVGELKDVLPLSVITMIFKSMSDEDLMMDYGLKLLSKGKFYR